jgi:putative phosphoesterase
MHWIVLSDTHGNEGAILDILEAEPAAAGFIHLGDLAADMEHLKLLTTLPVVQVAGNCDHGSPLPRELELVIGRVRLLLTHGDIYGVKGGVKRLLLQAKHRQCSAVLYGHSHQAVIETIDGILLINPGTLQANSPCRSYIRLSIEGKVPEAELVLV